MHREKKRKRIMLTEKKLLSLKERTRWRKISMILSQNARDLRLGKNVDWTYLNSIIPLAGLEQIDTQKALEDPKHAMFVLEDYANALLCRLGAEPSDWDFTDSDGSLDVSKRLIQDKVLVLDRIRSPFNVGSIFRSADSFGIKKIILVEGTASPEHPRARRTSRGCIDTVEWVFMTEEETVEYLKNSYEEIVALELGGQDVNTYEYRPQGAAVLGSEEFGISPGILACCTSRVSIPMAGTKGSLNVSVAAGIFLQAWFSHGAEA